MSRKSLISLTAILLLVAIMLFAIPLGCAKEEEGLPSWELNADVTASFSDNGKYGYILTVDGTGDMPDYSSEKETPWYGKSGRVTEIVVEDGITNIGDNAFTCCYYAKTVILPASVTKIGKNAFPASTKVYCHATEIIAGEGTTAYAYSENQPTAPGNYWHEVNGKPAVWPYVVTTAQKVLFIGNSYTFYNDMPTMFENIANGAGAEVTVESITTGSQSLKNWSDPTTEDGARVEEKLTASSDYDIIVLQEKSTSPVNDDYRYFVSGAKALAKRIGETQDNCRIFLYETWGSPAYAGSYGGTIPEMESRLRTAYDTVAESIGATVSYVGKAFTYMYENRAEINLYNTEDRSHPSYEGSYLAACVHATTLLGLNVENSTYNGTLDADTAALLKEVGYSISVGADIAEITYDMQIAVYSRYADASVIGNLVAAFKEDYAAKNSVGAPAIKYSLLGASNTNVAAFGGLVNAGSYDIILAAGNNINTTGGVTVIAKKSYRVVDSVYPNGDNRYVCQLTENELAVAFYDFMDTDTAKLILDPNYVPDSEAQEITVNLIVKGAPYGEAIVVSNATSAAAKILPAPEADTGYVFKGWALTETVTEDDTLYTGGVTYATFEGVAAEGAVTLYAIFEEGEVIVYDLRIAVYHDTFDTDLAEQLAKAFETWCADKSIELSVGVQWTKLDTTTQAAFSEEAVNGGYNVAIGFRANSFASGTPIKDIVIKGIATNRRVALLIDDDIAHEFYYNFMESGVAKKILNEDYITEAEADKIVITFMNGDTQYGEETLTVSNATDAKAKTLPAIDDEKFKGWATEDGETVLKGNISYADVENLATAGTLTLYAKFSSDDNPYSLTVAFHLGNSYITSTEADNVISGFKETLKGTEYENADIEAVKITVNAVGSANSEVSGNSSIDVYVGGGNMDSASNNGVTLDETYGKVDVKSGTFANTSRKVGIMAGKADNQLAVLFYQYITGTPQAEGE